MGLIPDIPDDANPLPRPLDPVDLFGPNRKGRPAPKRSTRPIDPIIKPTPKMTGIATLPASFRVIIDAADHWPYPDPDSNGLALPEPYLDDYTPDPEIEPFSEDEPWGKMGAESPRDYLMFSYFRSLGITRTQKQVSAKFDIPNPRVSSIAAKNNWASRVSAWDNYRERVYTTELLMGVKEMAHKHAEIARTGIEALAIVFTAISDQLADSETRDAFMAELSELPARSQILLAHKTGQVIPNLMSAERLSRGLPTEINASLHHHEHSVTVQSTDDLAAIITGLLGPLTSVEPDIIDAEVIEDDD